MAVPLAYFLTWRSYGTWLPGDQRGWINKDRNLVGQPVGTHDSVLHDRAQKIMRGSPFVMNTTARGVVLRAIGTVSSHRSWRLIACSVRTNHVHVVLSCDCTPEKAMGALKAWSTRKLREAGEAKDGQDVWARHGSTIWLWDADQVEKKRDYVNRLQAESTPAVLKRHTS